tara:strand:- start:7086 stop:7424 length:339 start_codon:yes stop_codon:yes gene_type:complete
MKNLFAIIILTLISLSVYAKPGSLTIETDADVRAFQKTYNLVADGIVGPNTLKKMSDYGYTYSPKATTGSANTKVVCRNVKLAAGKIKKQCKTIKIHKKFEGTTVPTKKTKK